MAAYDLAASRLVWTQPGEVTTRIAVGGDVIIHGGNARGAGRPARRRRRARHRQRRRAVAAPLAADERLAGYDIDANAVYLVVQNMGAGTQGSTGSVVALDPRTQAVRWRHELPTGRVAGPAVRGGLRRRPGRFAVRDPARRRDGRRAGAGAVDRRGGDLRARAAGGDVLRLARRVPAVAVDRARVAPGVRLPAGAAARRSSGRSTGTTCIVRSRRSTRRSIATTSCGASPSRASARASATTPSSSTTTASCSGSTRRRARCAGPTAIRRTRSRRRTRAA